ncbi:MAG TPA: cation:proton antiporter [Gammaproteobacteria bacterium]|nr:cation:proton antiporter [Gammaproteobacteria bacterium]
MNAESITDVVFLIFTGAAVLATLGLYARQSLPVVYIALGVLVGPWGLGWVGNVHLVEQIAHIGIIFLLFLLGMNLAPQKLLAILGRSLLVTCVSSLLFLLLGSGLAGLFGFGFVDALIIGAAMMFSSTILGIKLLPTTVLHHRHTGELIISILLLQDLLAIVILMLLRTDWQEPQHLWHATRLLLALLGVILFAWLFERHVLIRLMRRFDRIHEYLFLLAIGWCLGVAKLAALLGLSAEIGAFIAGVVLATNPVALYIGDSLRPLRDFFLILFFFALGAGFDLGLIPDLLWPALLLAGLMLLAKPLVFTSLLRGIGEAPHRAREVGMRLGQISEFSLFIAVLALQTGTITPRAAYLVQLATIFTFIVSAYVIVMRYPSPIALDDRLRRD